MKKFVVAVVLGSLLFSSPSFSKEKEPVLAGVLSALIPGVGQVYNGQVLKGAIYFLGISAGASLSYTEKIDFWTGKKTTEINPGWALLTLGLYVLNIVDAVVANAINEGKEVGPWDLVFKLRKDGIGLALCYKMTL